MLVSVSDSSDTTIYAYDGDGNRISKTADSVTTKYINDVGLPLVQVLMETNESDTVLASYTYGNDLISSHNSSLSTDNYYQYDGLGTTRQMTDATEAVVASYTYDAFGNLISSTGTTTNAYGFTGEQQFGEADNLVFLRARYYDSRVGRFISRDPIGYWFHMDNLYSYCKNNSVNYVDLSGLAWWDPTSWNTTNYCGWTKSGPGSARSKIDACCKTHDECVSPKGDAGSCFQIGRKNVRDCNADLAKCALDLLGSARYIVIAL
jgi:RHS repeat-associated protein